MTMFWPALQSVSLFSQTHFGLASIQAELTVLHLDSYS